MIPILESLKSMYKDKFIIHLHNADRVGLHYDIRIENNGFLDSWACRYIPDLISGKKKKILIIKQDPHNLEWFDFKGEITDGYGKGKISIWDKGSVEKVKWENDKHYIVTFKGTKLKGTFHILQYKGNKKTQFLMFKAK